MTERLTIDHVGQRGDGVARGGAEPVYVPFTLPGEIVETDPWPGQADRRRLTRIESASPQRIVPFCPHFGTCGGCAIQHWQDGAYRAWKRQLVVDALAYARIDCDVADIIDAHGNGRRRITVHARRDERGATHVGFAAPGSHAIVPIDHCPIIVPALDGALDAARALAEALKPANKPLDIQITAADNGFDVDIRGSGPLDTKLLSEISALADKHNLARLTRHGELVVMRAPPVLRIGKAQVTLPPGSFMQPTAEGEAILADLVMERCKGAKLVADLFCGFGPFALRLAEKFRVTAFDNDGPAIVSLQNTIRSTQGLKPITAESRDLFRRPLVPQELRDIDTIVFDPPRQGAEAQSQQLAQSKIRNVVSVSCNPATFARDARILIDGGYTIGTVTPVDQFRHTPHVEVVARFKR
jgi:23S rRNA (uracil1939-C5)-methyltransferase